MKMRRIAVVGGGAWGTALANVSAASGAAVTLLLRDAAAAALLQRTRVNERYLPGVALHPKVEASTAPGDLGQADAVLVVVPTQSLRATLVAFAGALPRAPLVICAKGIERGTGLFVSDIVAEICPGAVGAVLSGPSFAADVARGLPTAVTLAARDEAMAADLAAALSGPSLRLYHTTDVRGVEIGGAAKNVLAIAAGMVAGRGLGESARAALIARGFAEIARFAAACGARPETLSGLSGLGDVLLSCASSRSRNFAFGERLGRGASLDEAAAGALAEGAWTAAVLAELARARGVEMPIASAVEAVLSGQISIERVIETLMARPLRAEA